MFLFLAPKSMKIHSIVMNGAQILMSWHDTEKNMCKFNKQ